MSNLSSSEHKHYIVVLIPEAHILHANTLKCLLVDFNKKKKIKKKDFHLGGHPAPSLLGLTPHSLRARLLTNNNDPLTAESTTTEHTATQEAQI